MFPLLFLLALCSCGGGGEDETPRIPELDGTWSGTLDLILDQCFLEVNPLSEVHEVAIDGDAVSLISTDGRVLEGSATSNTSFDVSISDGQAFPTIDRITYTAISNGYAQVEVSHTLSRPGGCKTSWSGEMTRQ